MPVLELDVREKSEAYSTVDAVDIGVAQLARDGVRNFTIAAVPTPVRAIDFRITFNIPSDPADLRRLLNFEPVRTTVRTIGPLSPRRD